MFSFAHVPITNTGPPGGGDDAPFSGYWTPEEKLYCDSLMQAFYAGSINGVKPGTSLRSFLAKKLDCNVKRISKKYEGVRGYKGRHRFQPIHVPVPVHPETDESQSIAQELQELETKFWASRELYIDLKAGKVPSTAGGLFHATVAAPRGPHPHVFSQPQASGLVPSSTNAGPFVNECSPIHSRAGLNMGASASTAHHPSSTTWNPLLGAAIGNQTYGSTTQLQGGFPGQSITSSALQLFQERIRLQSNEASRLLLALQQSRNGVQYGSLLTELLASSPGPVAMAGLPLSQTSAPPGHSFPTMAHPITRTRRSEQDVNAMLIAVQQTHLQHPHAGTTMGVNGRPAKKARMTWTE
eukprot:Sro258_g101111.2  (354) ;mRNA; r:39228-40289